MIRLITLGLIICSSPLIGQKRLENNRQFAKEELASRQLANLERDSSKFFYRIWIEPDLIIEVSRKVVITLYVRDYNSRKKKFEILDVRKYEPDVPAKQLIAYFDSVAFSSWGDKPPIANLAAMGTINDGNRIIVEYSDKTVYKAFDFLGPITNQHGDSRLRVLSLINFLAESINPDEFREKYYQQMAENKTAMQRLKGIQEYPNYYRKQIEQGIFPKMWGDF